MDGTVLASATTDHVVRCWDAALFHRWQAEVENEEEEDGEESSAARASATAAGIGGSLSLGSRGGGGGGGGGKGGGRGDGEDAGGSATGDGGGSGVRVGGGIGADGREANSSNTIVSSGEGFYRKDMFCAIPTGSTDVFKLRFTERNLLVGTGAQVSNRVGPNGQRKDPTVVCAA